MSATCRDGIGVARAAPVTSDVEVADLAGLSPDEVTAWLDPLPHQRAEHLVRFTGIGHLHPEKGARLWIHGRFPELLRVHLTEPLEALDSHVLCLPIARK